MTLDDMIDFAAGHMRVRMERGLGIGAPALVYQNESGNLGVIVVPELGHPAMKAVACELLADLLEQEKAQRYVLTLEAWSVIDVRPLRDKSPEQAAREARERVFAAVDSLEDHPKRQECVWYVAADRLGHTTACLQQIERAADGKISLGPREGGFEGMTGRFTELLQRRPRGH